MRAGFQDIRVRAVTEEARTASGGGGARWNRPQACRSSLAAWGLRNCDVVLRRLRPQSNAGAMISANELRARFSRDFTVPRLQDVISAISSYDFPSSSRRMKTCL